MDLIEKIGRKVGLMEEVWRLRASGFDEPVILEFVMSFYLKLLQRMREEMLKSYIEHKTSELLTGEEGLKGLIDERISGFAQEFGIQLYAIQTDCNIFYQND